MATDNFCSKLPNRLIQTSQTGGQLYSDTSPFSIPFFKYYPWKTLKSNIFLVVASLKYHLHARSSARFSQLSLCFWFRILMRFQSLLKAKRIAKSHSKIWRVNEPLLWRENPFIVIIPRCSVPFMASQLKWWRHRYIGDVTGLMMTSQIYWWRHRSNSDVIDLLMTSQVSATFTRLRTCPSGSWASRRSSWRRRKTPWCWTTPRWPWTWRESVSPPGSGAGWPVEST